MNASRLERLQATRAGLEWQIHLHAGRMGSRPHERLRQHRRLRELEQVEVAIARQVEDDHVRRGIPA